MEALGLIHFALSVHTTGLAVILEEFQDMFKGIGRLRHKEIRLHIDKSIQPVELRHWRKAFDLRPKVEEELRKLQKARIIEQVEGPTPWVSPIVVTQKLKQPGEVRICIDMHPPIPCRHQTGAPPEPLCR